jgi:rfaE bifunctional protein kinase chain/domain
MKKIFVIGDLILDKYDYCLNRSNPESSAPCFTVQKTIYKLGGAGNVVANLSSLGSKVFLVSVCGNDFESNILLDLLNGLKIEQKILINSKRKTILKERTLDLVDHRYHFRKDIDYKYNLSTKEINDLIEVIDSESYVIISDYNKGTISNELMNILTKKTKNIIVDPKPSNANYYINSFIITPNLKEAFEITGCDNFQEAGEVMLKKFNSNILLKRSEKGMSYFGLNGERINLPTDAKDVFDVTGAGDTVIATLTHFINKGLSIEESIKLANKAAGISVSHMGCYQIKEDELK